MTGRWLGTHVEEHRRATDGQRLKGSQRLASLGHGCEGVGGEQGLGLLQLLLEGSDVKDHVGGGPRGGGAEEEADEGTGKSTRPGHGHGARDCTGV